MIDIKVNDKINWVSSVGSFTGTVTKKYRGLNAANQVIDWVVITHFNPMKNVFQTVVFPVTKHYFAMMKVQML